MRRLISLAVLGAIAAGPAQSAPVSLSAAARRDVTCFMLFAAATNDANVANDEKKRQGLSMGLLYYYGKLAVESPGIKMADAVRRQAAALQKDPKAKDIAGGCDAEFGKAGSDLSNLGQELQKDASPGAPAK